MQPAEGELPAGPGWAVELAWDGLRCIAYARPGRVRLLTTEGRPVTSAFPELAVLGDKAPRRGMILDGTVVAFDGAGIGHRRLLVRRTAAARPSSALVADVPVGFLVSDLLWLDGAPTVALPYARRRELVDGLGLAEMPVLLSTSWPADDPGVLQTAERFGVDALHAKRLDAAYRPGQRSRSWLRVTLQRTRQVVVGGWNPADPRRPESVGALLLGAPGPAGLRYVGRVGLGSGAVRRPVTELLGDLRADASPFTGALPPSVAHDAVWAVPRLVGRVRFPAWTADQRLRLPTWLGLVGPDEVDDALWEDGPDDGPYRGDSARPAADAGPGGPPGPAAPAAAPEVARRPGQAAAEAGRTAVRRLEQHFVYNSLSTIASLVRTDPARARELLLGFADLTRAADQPADAVTTLGDELAAVRAYLQLEQARFGSRLQVEVTVDPALHETPVTPLVVLNTVRAAVQQRIEPRPEGGTLRVTGEDTGTDCVITVTDDGPAGPVRLQVGAPAGPARAARTGVAGITL
ncbi:histidine kinase [Pseudonocardia acidicola]|uniref:DNA ligase (ATP) n=1 Tax=Pseudonocardia acidicola TaxID=2724939 RepID=A0ABX1S9E2_9PSEU|nr:histidine kinase [Pseudonocardia acidicola]NMH98185.1 histidine kinase [Pseudonocardia acidicola]